MITPKRRAILKELDIIEDCLEQLQIKVGALSDKLSENLTDKEIEELAQEHIVESYGYPNKQVEKMAMAVLFGRKN